MTEEIYTANMRANMEALADGDSNDEEIQELQSMLEEALDWIDNNRATWVNVYDYGRAYGGPEEGGWWFDTGTPVLCVNMADQPDGVTSDQVYDRLSEAYPRTGASSSVLGGEDYIVRIEHGPGQPFPEEYPHYE